VTRPVLVSTTFRQQFHKLDSATQARLQEGLAALAEDPVTPRPGADIRSLRSTVPPKHRLRVGSYRIIYIVEPEAVKVLELFRRGRGYR